jgi:hypothetical protein
MISLEYANSGTTLPIEFVVTYKSTGENVLSADIEGAVFLVKKLLSNEDEDAVITKDLTDGITKANGKVTVTLVPEDTEGLLGKHFATLKIFLTSGAVLDWEDTDYPSVPYIELHFRQGAVKATTL